MIKTLKSYGMPVYATELDVDISHVSDSVEYKNAVRAQAYINILEGIFDSGVCNVM